jgi:predicted AAA+ superfamily ATPase
LNAQIRSAYDEYLIYGGYPKVALTKSYELKTHILKEIQTTYIEKEVRSLITEDNYKKFSSLVEFLAAQNGGLVNITEISKEVGIARDTVLRYVNILEQTYIIKTIRPWARNRQKELTRMPKSYFIDTGFLNYTLKNFGVMSRRPDAGMLVESAIFTTLLRELTEFEDVRFWRTKSKEEIDFLLKRNDKLIPIEVKWSERPKLPAGFRAFLKSGAAPQAYVVMKNYYGEESIHGKNVKFLPPWALRTELWNSHVQSKPAGT